MQTDGKAWLYVPAGLTDGPLPTHYEPAESPFAQSALLRQQSNPARETYYDRPRQPSTNPSGSDVFPYVFTTYRLTEHHTAGGMSRGLPYLSELQPEIFCEVCPELAAERGLDASRVGHDHHRPRGDRSSRAGDRPDARRLRVHDRTMHQIGLPYHWGPQRAVLR